MLLKIFTSFQLELVIRYGILFESQTTTDSDCNCNCIILSLASSNNNNNNNNMESLSSLSLASSNNNNNADPTFAGPTIAAASLSSLASNNNNNNTTLPRTVTPISEETVGVTGLVSCSVKSTVSCHVSIHHTLSLSCDFF
jgi:hypothetical protein